MQGIEVGIQIKEISSNGKRWMAKETVFSSIKRMFGEYVSATRFQNMVKEMMILKVSLYNLFRRMA
jgi:outer membrane protein assembly factor BamA